MIYTGLGLGLIIKEFVYNRLVGTIRWGHSMDDDWKQPFVYKACEQIDFFSLYQYLIVGASLMNPN